jgi:hypothetical protein
LTSGRSCSAARVVFFIAQAESVEPVPKGVDPDLDGELLVAALLKFRQRQIGLLGDPPAQRPLMVLQARATYENKLISELSFTGSVAPI